MPRTWAEIPQVVNVVCASSCVRKFLACEAMHYLRYTSYTPKIELLHAWSQVVRRVRYLLHVRPYTPKIELLHAWRQVVCVPCPWLRGDALLEIHALHAYDTALTRLCHVLGCEAMHYCKSFSRVRGVQEACKKRVRGV
jgi:hypothetical protein